MVRLHYPPYDVLVAEVDGVPCAIEDACNHAGASLTEGWRVGEDIEPNDTGPCVACPVHGYIFDLRSGDLLQPAKLCDAQRTFRARIEGDEVVVEDTFSLVLVGP